MGLNCRPDFGGGSHWKKIQIHQNAAKSMSTVQIFSLLLLEMVVAVSGQHFATQLTHISTRPDRQVHYNPLIDTFPEGITTQKDGYIHNFYRSLQPETINNAGMSDLISYHVGREGNMGISGGKNMDLVKADFMDEGLMPTPLSTTDQHYAAVTANANDNLVNGDVNNINEDDEMQEEKLKNVVNENGNIDDSLAYGTSYSYGRTNSDGTIDYNYYQEGNTNYYPLQNDVNLAFHSKFNRGRDYDPKQLLRPNINSRLQFEKNSAQKFSVVNNDELNIEIKNQQNKLLRAVSNQNNKGIKFTSRPQAINRDGQIEEKPDHFLESQLLYSHVPLKNTDDIHLDHLQDLQKQYNYNQDNFKRDQYQEQHPKISTLMSNFLPPITTTVHHTPTSTKATAGIPLAKHVEITKTVPVTSYQQQLYPYKQSVQVPVPRTIVAAMPRPLPIKVPVSKTVAVPQLQELKIPIEKIKPFAVERRIPYVVERRVPFRVEKPIATPLYYPYPIKIPVVRTVVHKLPSNRHHYIQPHPVNGHFAEHTTI